MRKIEEKNPVRIDASHFCVFKSPNSMPRTTMKKMETATNINESPYATKRHHQGNVIDDDLFSVEPIFLLLLHTIKGEQLENRSYYCALTASAVYLSYSRVSDVMVKGVVDEKVFVECVERAQPTRDSAATRAVRQ